MTLNVTECCVTAGCNCAGTTAMTGVGRWENWIIIISFIIIVVVLFILARMPTCEGITK